MVLLLRQAIKFTGEALRSAAIEHDDRTTPSSLLKNFVSGLLRRHIAVKGWGLIKRFSEDIVSVPAASSRSKERNLRRGYRERILGALQAAEFELSGKDLKANEDRFFSADFAYPSEFGAGPGVAPASARRDGHAALDAGAGRAPDPLADRGATATAARSGGLCRVDPIETAADKLSALAWRVCARERGDAVQRADAAQGPLGVGPRVRAD